MWCFCVKYKQKVPKLLKEKSTLNSFCSCTPYETILTSAAVVSHGSSCLSSHSGSVLQMDTLYTNVVLLVICGLLFLRERMRLQKKFQKQFGVRQKWDQKSQVGSNRKWSLCASLTCSDLFNQQTWTHRSTSMEERMWNSLTWTLNSSQNFDFWSLLTWTSWDSEAVVTRSVRLFFNVRNSPVNVRIQTVNYI